MKREHENESDNKNREEYYKKYNGLWGESLSRLKNRLVYSRKCKDMICIYCGRVAQTREHCPPRSFFPDHDFPDNLRVLPACEECNKGYSQDEETVRDFLNCTYDRYCNHNLENVYPFEIYEYSNLTEKSKVLIEPAKRIFSKVAQGLAIYEMSDCFGDDGWLPEVTDYICRHWIAEDEWDGLQLPISIDVLPELGSRASDNFFIIQSLSGDGHTILEPIDVMWTELKENVFKYVTWIQDDIIRVRMILRDFFFIEVDFFRAME